MNQSINLGSHRDVVKPIVFKLTKKNENPATEGRFYPGVQGVPGEDVIYDPETNKSRPIRYSVNEESIYKNEQPSHVELTNIIFTNGSLRVYPDKPTLLEYLRVCNWNKGNKDRTKGKRPIFYEYDPVAIAQEKLESEAIQIDAKHKALHMDFDELKAIARAVGFNVSRQSSEIRQDMVVFATNQPREFMDSLDNPVVRRRVEVLEAIDLGILKKEQRAMYLKETLGDTSLCVIPVGQDPVDHFVQWTLSDKDGEESWKKVSKKRKKLLG